MVEQNKGTKTNVDLIPHKAPAIMVDTLVAWDELKARSRFRILPDNVYAKKEAFQLAGLIEHIAQTVALKMAVENQDKAPAVGYLTGISSMELSGKIKTGETIETTIEILKNMGSFIKTRSVSNIGKRRIAETEMSFFVAPKTQD